MEGRKQSARPKTPPLWQAPVEVGVEYEYLLVEGEDGRADELHELIASGYADPNRIMEAIHVGWRERIPAANAG